MSSRLQLSTLEAEKQRTEQANKEIQRQQAYCELQTQYRALTSTHSQCTTTQQSLTDRITALQRHQTQSDAAVGRYEDDLKRMVETISEQSARLQSLEAAASASQSSTASEEALRLAKTKVTKSKEQLKQKESQIAALLEELASSRNVVAGAEKKQRDANARMDAAVAEADRLRAELTALQPQLASNSAASSAQNTARKRGSGELKDAVSALRKDRKEWEKERSTLTQELDAARKSLAIAQAQIQGQQKDTSQSARGSRAQEEALQDAQHRNSQLLIELREARHAAEQSSALAQQLRVEHAKVAGALNKMMSSGGAGNTITIASKKGMFPEFVQLKRENERLQAQVAELQQTIHMLNTRAAQAQVTIHSQQLSHPNQPNHGPSNIQQLSRVASRPQVQASAQPVQPLQPSRSVSGLQLIAAHEASLNSSNGSSPAASSPPFPSQFASFPSTAAAALPPSGQRSSANGATVAMGSASAAAQRSAALSNMTSGNAIGRRSSGGWSTGNGAPVAAMAQRKR
jgi:chromosome segregation ATPase